MTIKVFPSANGVGSAGQKVWSEPNVKALIAALTPRNYVVDGLNLSGIGTGTVTVSSGSAMIAGQLVVVPDAVALPVGPVPYALDLRLTYDALGNAVSAKFVQTPMSVAPTSNAVRVGSIWPSGGVVGRINYTGRHTSAHGSPYNDFVNAVMEYHTYFDSIAGLVTAGTVTNNTGGYVQLLTTATAGATATLAKQCVSSVAYMSPHWDSEHWMAVGLDLHSIDTTNTEIWAIVGAPGVKRHLGFFINNGTVYGTIGNGTAETRTAAMAYRNIGGLVAHYVPEQYAEFWTVSDEYQSLTTGLPSSYESTAGDRNLVYLSIKTNEAVAKALRASQFSWRQQPA